MEEEFIPYELALALKELGFNENCLGWYSEFGYFSVGSEIVKKFYLHEKSCLAPLWQQAFRFFLERFKLDFSIERKDYEGSENDYYFYTINGITQKDIYECSDFEKKYTWDDSQLYGLKKLIEVAQKLKKK